MYEEVTYEMRLSGMVDRYCRLLGSETFTNVEIKAGTNLCCIDFPFDRAWLVPRVRYCSTDSEFEVNDFQANCEQVARVLVGWDNIELFAGRPQDRPFLYVGIESFHWSSYTYHRLLGSSALRRSDDLSAGLLKQPDSSVARRSATFVSSYCSHEIRGLYGHALVFGHKGKGFVASSSQYGSRLGYPVILPVSAGVQEVVDQSCLLEIVQNF